MKPLTYRYALERRHPMGDWNRWYDEPFRFTDADARAANEACKADYRFTRINDQPDR